jgi:Holliday junction resolvase
MNLQSKILKYLEGLDHCWAVKVISSNKRGCPDILCCYRGMFLAIEVKEGSGRATAIQKAQLDLIIDIVNGAQGIGLVARDLESVLNVICFMDHMNEGKLFQEG